MVGLGGLEPPTSRLSSARSNQLSYKPSGINRKTFPGIILNYWKSLKCFLHKAFLKFMTFKIHKNLKSI